MKKSRSLIFIIVVIFLVITLVGCKKDDVSVRVTNTGNSITVYTDKMCDIEFTIQFMNGEKVSTATKKFSFDGNLEEISLSIEDFVSDHYDEHAVITEVYYGEPQYTEAEIENFINAISITAIVIIVVIIFAKRPQTECSL